jgi:hypothetical protein
MSYGKIVAAATQCLAQELLAAGAGTRGGLPRVEDFLFQISKSFSPDNLNHLSEIHGAIRTRDQVACAMHVEIVASISGCASLQDFAFGASFSLDITHPYLKLLYEVDELRPPSIYKYKFLHR